METQKNLFQYIEDKGIKKSAICEATGINQNAMSRSSRCVRRLTVDEYGAICRFIGMPMDYFRD